VCAAGVLHFVFLLFDRSERLYLVESKTLRTITTVIKWDGFLVESAEDFPNVAPVIFNVSNPGLGDGLFYPGALIVVGEVDAGGIK